MPDKPAGWDEPDRLNRENANQEPVPANPPSSGVSDVPLIAALEQIARWDGFPHTGTFWEDSGNEMSYGAAFGSNGERDYMRSVARAALAKARGEKPDAE